MGFIANVIASVLMGWYIYRKHPKLGGEFRQALGGTDDFEVMDTSQPGSR